MRPTMTAFASEYPVGSAEYKREYHNWYYHQNKETIYKRARIFCDQAVIRNRQYVVDHLKKNPCVDCGMGDVRVLDFDHVRGEKYKEVSQMIRGGVGLEKLQKEIDKCDIRCANCHRIVTHKRNPSFWSNKIGL